MVLKPGLNFFAIPLNSPTYRYMCFHLCISITLFYTLMFSKNVFATKFKNYFLELATCSGNCSGTVERLRHYSSIVLLFGNQHVDHSLFFVILFLMVFVFEFKIN